MNPGFRLRLFFLIGAICLIAGLAFLEVERSWTRVFGLEHRLTREQLLNFQLADQFERQLLSLNISMLQYAARRDQSQWNMFEKASDNLNRWIDLQVPKLHTELERSILNKINAAYDDYLAAANQIHTNPPPAGVAANVFGDLNGFEYQSQRLIKLSAKLTDAHQQAEEIFLSGANSSLDNLRWLLFSALSLLLVTMMAIGWLLYRDLVAPLRTRLVESMALLERQEKLATLGTLAAGIAHEIRNPLTSIKARLYTLGKHIRGNEAGVGDAVVISGEISRLERIVQDVLHFARPSDPELRVVAAAEPLLEVQSLVGSSLDASRVELRFEPGPELFVSIDPSLIKQVLINLVRNAADAIEDNGIISLRVREARMNLHGKECAVAILEVADNGKGIPIEVGKRLFDPFFTTKEAGTGLGLPIALRIVEKHGGALQYQSQAGHGTTFGIVLPQVNSQTAQVKPNEPAAGEIAKVTA
jgi:signal transduction histidine kinase